jgi:ligand-binding SRPBCC domain-containing protein
MGKFGRLPTDRSGSLPKTRLFELSVVEALCSRSGQIQYLWVHLQPMATITSVTIIHAPVEACFRSSLSIDLELAAAKNYSIKAIGGITTGIIGAGERVTWQTRQFGLRITHTTEITGFDSPVYFQDSMVEGIFHSFQHDHFFRSMSPTKTEMRDEVRFRMPVVLGGQICDLLVVKRRLTKLLLQRNLIIQKDAETNGSDG